MKPDIEGGCCRPISNRGRRLRAALAEFFESHLYHASVIFLIALDLCLVITDIALSLVYCSNSHNDGHNSGEHAAEGAEGSHGSSHSSTPHAVHITEEALAWGSVGILSIFVLEFLIQLLVLGPKHFKHVAQVGERCCVLVVHSRGVPDGVRERSRPCDLSICASRTCAAQRTESLSQHQRIMVVLGSAILRGLAHYRTLARYGTVNASCQVCDTTAEASNSLIAQPNPHAENNLPPMQQPCCHAAMHLVWTHLIMAVR